MGGRPKAARPLRSETAAQAVRAEATPAPAISSPVTATTVAPTVMPVPAATRMPRAIAMRPANPATMSPAMHQLDTGIRKTDAHGCRTAGGRQRCSCGTSHASAARDQRRGRKRSEFGERHVGEPPLHLPACRGERMSRGSVPASERNAICLPWPPVPAIKGSAARGRLAECEGPCTT